MKTAFQALVDSPRFQNSFLELTPQQMSFHFAMLEAMESERSYTILSDDFHAEVIGCTWNYPTRDFPPSRIPRTLAEILNRKRPASN
jgi:hypothetical protein